MNEIWSTILAVACVSLGVLAEIHLLGALLRERRGARRHGRCSFPSEPRRPSAEGPPSRRSHVFWPLPTVSGLVLLPGLALGVDPTADDDAVDGGAGPLSVSTAFSLQPAQPPPPAEAKPLTISTNRPSFDDTAGIVQIGHWQLETGYTFTYRDRDGVESRTSNAPEVLLRLPILDDRLELQLGTSGYVWTSSNDGTGSVSNEGFSDMTVGLRLKVLDEDGWIPRLALQGVTTTSLGSDGISNQDLEPVFKMIWSYTLKDGWGVYGNLGVGYMSTSGQRFVQGQGGVCVTYTINDRWSVYGEYYLFGPNSKGTDAAHYADFGAAFLITPRIQLDGRVGFGLNSEANNAFTGFGISFLF